MPTDGTQFMAHMVKWPWYPSLSLSVFFPLLLLLLLLLPLLLPFRWNLCPVEVFNERVLLSLDWWPAEWTGPLDIYLCVCVCVCYGFLFLCFPRIRNRLATWGCTRLFDPPPQPQLTFDPVKPRGPRVDQRWWPGRGCLSSEIINLVAINASMPTLALSFWSLFFLFISFLSVFLLFLFFAVSLGSNELFLTSFFLSLSALRPPPSALRPLPSSLVIACGRLIYLYSRRRQ